MIMTGSRHGPATSSNFGGWPVMKMGDFAMSSPTG